MRFAQEISIFNPHAIEMAVVALGTRITQTAEEIRLEAAQTLSNYSTTVQMNAAISTKADEITSEVSQTYATQQSVNNSVSSLSSRITQNANSISSEVTNRQNADSSLSSRITQNANSISSEITARQNGDSSLSSRITQNANSISSEITARQNGDSSLSSRIEQTATAISFTLSGGGTGTNANKASLSMRYTKEDGSTISLASQTITFNGLVKFTDLSTSGSTTINGSNITTGSIKDANSNTVFNLTDGTLTMKKGSINLGNGTFSVTNAGKLTASDIYINAPLGSTGSRVYAYDIGGTRLNMGDGSTSNATFFANTTTRIIRTSPYIQFLNATGGVLGSLELDGDTTGNPNTRRMLFTNGLKISSTYGEWFLCKSYAQFDGGVGDGSDRRMKQDIKPLSVESAVHTILNLKPVQYAYKSDPKYIHHGFIAQDVQEIVHDWDVVRESENGMLGLSYNDFIADLVATVQYQNKRIEEIERCMASI